ncbi:hypothetical protein [Caulobacter sp. DWR2-3-1b2]|uniref:hypothetical protein n=1 Tax=unclassified Caulobacter TaxID=2648921 RepID=UPI003CF9933D
MRSSLTISAWAERAEASAPARRSGAHQLTGDREGVWSLTVTKNWRMTFRIDDALAIEDMDREDYR